MLKLSLLTLATFVIAFVLVAAAAAMAEGERSLSPTTIAYERDQIRCAVCRRAIAYVWHQSATLRTICKEAGNAGKPAPDPRCDFGNVHHFGVEEMTHQVCDKLPKTHRAIEGSEFDLIVHEHEDAGQLHTAENAAMIRNTCVQYVHDDKGIDNVALYIFANIDAGKSTGTILHSLQHRFCKDACNPHYKLARHVEDPSMPDARYRDGRYREGDL
jgi:hypothetical protein